MQSNNIWLTKVMKRHGLTRAWVATQLCVDTSTVDRWLQPEVSTSFRRMPSMARKLLGLILEDHTQ